MTTSDESFQDLAKLVYQGEELKKRLADLEAKMSEVLLRLDADLEYIPEGAYLLMARRNELIYSLFCFVSNDKEPGLRWCTYQGKWPRLATYDQLVSTSFIPEAKKNIQLFMDPDLIESLLDDALADHNTIAGICSFLDLSQRYDINPFSCTPKRLLIEFEKRFNKERAKAIEHAGG